MAQPPESGTTLDNNSNDLLTNPPAGAPAETAPDLDPDANASKGSNEPNDGDSNDVAPQSADSGMIDDPEANDPKQGQDNHMSGPVTAPELESFDDFKLDPKLRAAIAAMGWVKPSPVQSQAFLPLVDGRDLMVQSHTGSGKTGAFCLPWLAARFDSAPASGTGVQLLVVLPTRELAKQVCDELGRLANHLEIELLPVYGGTAMQPQLSALKAGVHAVVGTPGRILDHIRRRTLRLDRVRTVILDECDEMLSMGFLEDIRAILDACTAEHQTCLFSATLPNDVQRIARRYMREPEMITLSGDSVAAAEIDHAYYVISGMLRTRDLVDILTTEDPARAIIFCNTREETKLVANVLTREGYSAEALSSDLTQYAREKVMKAMRDHKIRFLVATDVAARGIDISHVTHVINYSFPEQAESYVHRTGRTGRAGRTGTAISLIGPRDIGNFYYLKLQYSSIKPEERHLPPPEELQAARIQLKIDEVSRLFPDQVSPQWVVLVRGLMGDPRGEQVIAFLLEQAMRSSRRPRSLLDEDDEERNDQGYAQRGENPAAGSEQLSSDAERRPSRQEREYEGDRGRERGPRNRDGRRGRDSRRGRDGRDRDGRQDRDGRRDRDGRIEQTGEQRRDKAPQVRAEQTNERTQAEAPQTRSDGPETAPRGDAPTETSAPDVTAQALATAPSEAPTSEAAADEQAEAPRPPRKTRRERRPKRSRRENDGTADNNESASATQDTEQTASGSAKSTGDNADSENADSPDAAGTREAKTDDDAQPRRRRRRRRRGRRKPGSEDTGTEASEASEPKDTPTAETHEPVATEASKEETAAAEESPGRRRRRRRSSSRSSRSSSRSSSSEITRQAKPKPIPRVSQDEIIIDIDESELDVVRDHFGEVDELDDLTLKGRRRAVIDTLHDEVEIVDLSSVDAEEECDEVEATAEANTPAEASDANQDTSGDSETPKKRRRRRRRKKTQPLEKPELTAPPHKDFWEVWSTRFTFTDFEDDKYLDKSELEDQAREAEAEAKAEAAAKEARSAPRQRARRSAQGEIPEASFVKLRLNLGRSHGQKASTIRALLREQLGLEGRLIRDLTVRDASTLFRTPEGDYERISSVLNGVEIGGVSITVTRPDGPKTDLRAPPPELPENDDTEASAAETEPTPAAQASVEPAPSASEPTPTPPAQAPTEPAEPAEPTEFTEPSAPSAEQVQSAAHESEQPEVGNETPDALKDAAAPVDDSVSS